ncbi:hypothetical protein SLEP1_g43357 [Rubroshorea leprosula]|uniref:Uncharacterized protein n=1 Tax=Rubroshorea leprosula TaxID=152421 RepID=A0AAV5LEA0_9ROSI|nr:hypothetical protein SLEP1_g43357 [Rubroshorea leprosula]
MLIPMLIGPVIHLPVLVPLALVFLGSNTISWRAAKQNKGQ